MELDKTYKVPEGFEPVLNYREEPETGTPVVGVARLVGVNDAYRLEFDVSDGAPTLPLKTRGSIEHRGWDIPTRYAIDADGVCWMDNAHGHPLSRTTGDRLIANAEDESRRNAIRSALGIEFPMPEWAQIAKRAGWTPPEGWTWRKS